MDLRQKIAQFMHEHTTTTLIGILALGVVAVYAGVGLHNLGEYLNQNIFEAKENRPVCKFETKVPEKQDAARRLNERIEECYQEYEDDAAGYNGLCIFRLEDDILGTEDLFQRNQLKLKCEYKLKE